jgi:predicted TIM-barrel fold metal-dependent hydrolase
MHDALFDTHAHLIADDPAAYPPSPMRGTTSFTKMTYTATADWLIGQMDAHGVAQACIVQRGHVYGYDNSYIIDSGKRFPDRFVPVVILDAQNPATPALLSRMVKEDGVRGVRFAQTLFDDYSTGWMNSPTAMECWRAAADLGIPVAIIFYRLHLPWALPALKFIAEQLPTLKIIIDHIGTAHTGSNPEMHKYREHGFDVTLPGAPDYGNDATIAMYERMPHEHFKLTEIVMDRLADQKLEPATFVRLLADRFGAGRLMWGSDLGQSEKGYETKAAMAREAAAALSAGERRQFLHDTAAQVYAR